MFSFKFKRNTHKETEAERRYVEREVKKIPKVISVIFFIYITIFLSLMIWYFYFKSTYYVSTVEGSSMQPTINVGIQKESQSEDMVYVNRRIKGERGDIVTIETSSDNKIIKRIIAKEGDKVSIYVADDGFYHVAIMYNWSQEVEILEEDYVKSYAEWRNGGNHSSEKILENVTYALDFYNTFLSDMGENVTKIDGAYYYQVPKDCYFCLGDNRAYSNDSRSRGVFKKSQIKGVAEIIIKGGSLESGSLASKKFNAIISYYWKRLEKSFMR
mgnify:CR=1 FL=1